MSRFAAKPHFNLSFSHNMPWFSHFEIKTDDQWKALNDSKFKWILKEGNNLLLVRPVNRYGIHGEQSKIDVDYN